MKSSNDDSPVTRNNYSASSSVSFVKNDPAVERIQWKGNLGKVLVRVGILAGIFIIFGLLGSLPATSHYLSFIGGSISCLLLTSGLFFAAYILWIIFNVRSAQRYWRHIGQLRQEAFQDPTHSVARQQPVGHEELPQPGSIHGHIGFRLVALRAVSVSLILFVLNVSVNYLSDPHRSLVTVLIVSLAYALFIGVVLFYSGRRVGKRSIRVTADGIITYANNTNNFIRWQDVRLFSRYRGQKTVLNSSKSFIYELAGEDMVVRIAMSSLASAGKNGQPQMNHDELERWYDSLYGYIIQRTGLKLMDLDSAVALGSYEEECSGDEKDGKHGGYDEQVE